MGGLELERRGSGGLDDDNLDSRACRAHLLKPVTRPIDLGRIPQPYSRP